VPHVVLLKLSHIAPTHVLEKKVDEDDTEMSTLDGVQYKNVGGKEYVPPDGYFS